MIQAFLSSLAPNLEQLLVEVSKHISDDMLLEIALADYGLEQKMHLARLRHLRDHGTFVEPMYWYPCEVLELIRNSNPAGSNDIRGHRVRVFACAALLRSKEAPWNKGGDCGTTSYNLVRLLKSIRELPPDFTRYAIQLLAWIMLHSDLEGQDEQAVYCGVGLLWLVLHFDAPPPDDDLIELSAWVVRREAEIHKSRPWAFDRWLLGIGNDPPPSEWESLGEGLLELEVGNHNRELQDWVKLIGQKLSGQVPA